MKINSSQRRMKINSSLTKKPNLTQLGFFVFIEAAIHH